MKPQPLDKELLVEEHYPAEDVKAGVEWLKQEFSHIDDPEIIARYGKTIEERMAILKYVAGWKEVVMIPKINRAFGAAKGGG